MVGNEITAPQEVVRHFFAFSSSYSSSRSWSHHPTDPLEVGFEFESLASLPSFPLSAYAKYLAVHSIPRNQYNLAYVCAVLLDVLASCRTLNLQGVDPWFRGYVWVFSWEEFWVLILVSAQLAFRYEILQNVRFLKTSVEPTYQAVGSCSRQSMGQGYATSFDCGSEQLTIASLLDLDHCQLLQPSNQISGRSGLRLLISISISLSMWPISMMVAFELHRFLTVLTPYS